MSSGGPGGGVIAKEVVADSRRSLTPDASRRWAHRGPCDDVQERRVPVGPTWGGSRGRVRRRDAGWRRPPGREARGSCRAVATGPRFRRRRSDGRAGRRSRRVPAGARQLRCGRPAQSDRRSRERQRVRRPEGLGRGAAYAIHHEGRVGVVERPWRAILGADPGEPQLMEVRGMELVDGRVVERAPSPCGERPLAVGGRYRLTVGPSRVGGAASGEALAVQRVVRLAAGGAGARVIVDRRVRIWPAAAARKLSAPSGRDQSEAHPCDSSRRLAVRRVSSPKSSRH